jgi:hypothetical protein
LLTHDLAAGVDGLLKDATRPSRVKPLSPELIERVVRMTLHERPASATHWSLRSMRRRPASPTAGEIVEKVTRKTSVGVITPVAVHLSVLTTHIPGGSGAATSRRVRRQRSLTICAGSSGDAPICRGVLSGRAALHLPYGNPVWLDEAGRTLALMQIKASALRSA